MDAEQIEIRKRVLPALMAEGLLDESYVDLLDFDQFWINKKGDLMAPDDYPKQLRFARPHLFAVRGYVKQQPDKLSTFVYPHKRAA